MAEQGPWDRVKLSIPATSHGRSDGDLIAGDASAVFHSGKRSLLSTARPS
jgi:hypothetical protein